jgi:hypothetical protein
VRAGGGLWGHPQREPPRAALTELQSFPIYAERVALGLIPSDAGLLCLQAGVVAAPRALSPEVSEKLKRFRGRGWALIPVGSIVGVIFAIKYAASVANGITWLALIAVPLLSVAALGWLMHGSRGWLALLVPVLFLLVWRTPHTLWGEGAGALLCGLSCVTLGVLIGAVTPAGWLKLGVVVVAGVDAYLIATAKLQAPNSMLTNAAPGSGLPQLQSEQWGSVSLGYEDIFVAGLLGALWSQRPRIQAVTALVTLACAGTFDLLFFFFGTLPATVPVALALIVMELWSRWRRRQCELRPVEAGGRDSSARLVTMSSPRAASSSTSVASSSERA